MSGLITNLDLETSMPAMRRTPKTRASAPPKPSTLCFNNLSEASTFSEGNHIALQKESLSLVFLPDVTAFTTATSFKHYHLHLPYLSPGAFIYVTVIAKA